MLLSINFNCIKAGDFADIGFVSGKLRCAKASARIYKALKDKTTLAEKRNAMNDVLDQCIREGILADFLRENQGAIMMSYFWEYDEEAHRRAMRDDGYETGRADEHKLTIAERGRADKAEAELNELQRKKKLPE